MGEARKAYHNRTSWDITPDITNPNIADEIGRTMAELFVWDSLNNRWVEAASDFGGRLLISPGVADFSGLSVRSLIVGLTETQILVANLKRQFARLIQGGLNEIQIGFRTGDAATNFIVWPNNSDFLINGYTGPVFGIAAIAPITIAVLEV